tara:strand:+ start:104 stop:304 length:201 start_codon:yes stop_codon:yes gene_type:complete
MKDQSPILEKETEKEKWDRGRALFLESLYKPDHELRGCSHNQKCFNELMQIREDVIEYVRRLEYNG